MAYSESAYEASKKYKATKIKRIPLDVQISFYEAIQAAAERSGEKVNTYIKNAITQRMERDALEGGIFQTSAGPKDKNPL